MPLPLKKLKLLSNVPSIEEEVDIISKRRKSTSALWVALVNGKSASPVFKTQDEVMNYMTGKESSYNIGKLHIQGDSELISKINKKYSV